MCVSPSTDIVLIADGGGTMYCYDRVKRCDYWKQRRMDTGEHIIDADWTRKKITSCRTPKGHIAMWSFH